MIIRDQGIGPGTSLIDLEPIFSQIRGGDPVGAAYRFAQLVGSQEAGRAFYEAGSLALAHWEDLGEDALRFARLVFTEAVERDPNLAEAHHDLATTMRELGTSEEAIPHYMRALELLPNDADCLIGLGGALSDIGQNDDAVTCLRRATEAQPQSGLAFANLGIALETARRHKEALAAYAKAITRYEAALKAATDGNNSAVELGELVLQKRWARIQYAELLVRLEYWAQAISEYRRLYAEEQSALERDNGLGFRNQETEESHSASDEELGSHLPQHPEFFQLTAAELRSLTTANGIDTTHIGERPVTLQEGDEQRLPGEQGLVRMFIQLLARRQLDLAYLILDELGGEIAHVGTKATYKIYDSGDGLPRILMVRWKDGRRRSFSLMHKPRVHSLKGWGSISTKVKRRSAP